MTRLRSPGSGETVQTMCTTIDGESHQLRLPAAEACLLPGIYWGAFDERLTPAYWKSHAWRHEKLGTYANPRLGRSLTEELAACLLGGYGMPAELGLAAYRRVRNRGLLTIMPTIAEVEDTLSEPFVFPQGLRRYRFPRQKARYLTASLRAIQSFDPPRSDVALRNQLMRLPGIGAKTASWIVRNHRGSDAVAIIDIHILRAGRHIGLFPVSWQPQRHYTQLECAFLKFAEALCVRASLLDALIWDYMRRISPIQNPSPAT